MKLRPATLAGLLALALAVPLLTRLLPDAQAQRGAAPPAQPA